MELPFETDLYTTLKSTWPQSGRHILGTFDDNNIVLYQAYNADIANYAIIHQTFLNCPKFSTSRMTWVKPNFLWMMYRSGWATKPNQDHILSITISREGFEEILQNSILTDRNKRNQSAGTSNERDKIEIDTDVRLQWDPDRNPKGDKEIRRAIQLGIKNKILDRFLKEWILKIDDITQFVKEQRKFIDTNALHLLRVPREKVYVLNDDSLATKIQLDN